MYQFHFFAHWRPFLSRPWVFPRALGCGARRGPACTLGASLGPGWTPWCVLLAFKFASDLVSNHRIAFRLGEPSRSMETPNCLLFCFFSFFHHCFVLLLFLKYDSSPRRLGSGGTTAAARQAFPFVTATNASSACVRACVIL